MVAPWGRVSAGRKSLSTAYSLPESPRTDLVDAVIHSRRLLRRPEP